MVRMQPTVADFDDGGKKTQSKECKWLLEAEKGKEMDHPQNPSERNTSLADTFILAQ